MKAVVILDSAPDSAHPLEAVMLRRGYIVYRSDSVAGAIAFCQGASAPGQGASAPADLAIVKVPLQGSASQTAAATQIHRACPGVPLLLISDTPLEAWPEEDFGQFEKLLTARVDLLLNPLSQASFLAKVNALLYTVSYADARTLFTRASALRTLARAV